MDKNAIKKFAIWARRELITRVSQRAAWYGITEKDPIDDQLQAVHGQVLTKDEQAQRRALINRVKAHGYQQTMEEVAYTWFNRFIALRFMEVNGYLPSRVRVFSDEADAFNPQVLTEAIHVEIDGLDKEKVYALEEANEKEALFKYLIIAQCNELNAMLPGMFQTIADYTELLFPDYLLREGSVLHQMVTTIPEDDWKDAVQIIGWLYQYYNAEPKDEVFAALKKNIKVSKDKIPAATQLFTPDWIVRYMVENSLGRLWVEGHPNDELKANWKYYLEEAPQEPEVETQLAAIRAQYAKIEPSQILAVDPCMGSGHILVYMFDVLMQIYLSYGYTTNEAVESIVRNNLWGMDIDDRAAQLTYFAVMMKARQYDRRWFSRHIEPNVFAIQDAPAWTAYDHALRETFARHNTLAAEACIATAKKLFDCFADAKEYGSILQPDLTLDDLTFLSNGLDELVSSADLLDMAQQANVWSLVEVMKPLLQQAQALVQKYHVVVTNPPYMSPSNSSGNLANYAKKHFPNSKSDLFGIFIEQNLWLSIKGSYIGMITQHSWMFLSTFEKFRYDLTTAASFVSFAHLGVGTFVDLNSKVVQSAAFILRNGHIKHYSGSYDRLFEHEGFYEDNEEKAKWLITGKHRYYMQQDRFLIIPGCPIAYWLPSTLLSDFEYPKLKEVARPRLGLFTYDNDRFLRLWYEVKAGDVDFHLQSFADQRGNWIPHNKGGKFRRWYGNNEYIVWYKNKGEDIKNVGIINNEEGYLQRNITWTALTTANNPFRLSPVGCSFDSNKGPFIEDNQEHDLYYLLGLLNTKVAGTIFGILNPTISLQNGDLDRVPIIIANEHRKTVERLVRDNVQLSEYDWDSFETSYDFRCHPLVSGGYKLIADEFGCWTAECLRRFLELKANEEELNRIFIDIYGLQGELTPDVADKDVTVRRADLKRDIKSLISYAVGCMLGRYSLDRPGLQFAGGDWKSYAAQSEKDTWQPDKDGILPITEDEYFDDDIVAMFVEWVKTVYGADTLEENLQFIASALGGTGSARQVIRQYFLNDFFKDHCATYSVTGSGKRPIYWLFDSGKKNGFKCLVYMHRYQPDTLARIRTDYVHEVQSRYRSAIETLERQLVNAGSSERVKLQKQLTTLKAKAEEVRVYEEKIHHLADQMIKIDLDDGVKHNYAIFQDVLAPIK